MKRLLYALTLTVCWHVASGDVTTSEALTWSELRSHFRISADMFEASLANNQSAEMRQLGQSLRAAQVEVETSIGSDKQLRVADLGPAQRVIASEYLRLSIEARSVASAVISSKGSIDSSTLRRIRDADIIAYELTTGSGCQTQMPRVVYSDPEEIDSSTVRLSLRGNYLDAGDATVSVNDVAVPILLRSKRQLVVGLPESLAHKQDNRVVTINLSTFPRVKTLGVFGCKENLSDSSVKIVSLVSLRDNRSVFVSGSIGLSRGALQPFRMTRTYERSDAKCDALYSVSEQWCLPEGKTLSQTMPFQLEVRSTNCRSSVGTPRVTSERCVVVPAQLGGCGAIRLPFGITECRGRGWLSYAITLVGEASADEDPKRYQFTKDAAYKPDLLLRFVDDRGGNTSEETRWSYQATIVFKIGDRELRAVRVSESTPSVDDVVSSISRGVLTLRIK